MFVNFRFFAPFVAILCLLAPGWLSAQTNDPQAQLQALIEKINSKLRAGERAETNLTKELAQFDVLLRQHKQQQTDAVAEILFAEVKLYVEVLGNTERGIELMKRLKRDYPETDLGKESDRIIADLQRQLAASQLQRSLVPGAKFPDFEAKDLAGKPVSVASYKGKLLLVDFWATWCGPCVRELPNVLKAFEEFHSREFEIIGLSLDQDEQRLKSFIQDHKVPWPQVFEGHGWENKLVAKYGIQAIPATFLLDRDGKIIARDLRGDELHEALAKALPPSQTSTPKSGPGQ